MSLPEKFAQRLIYLNGAILGLATIALLTFFDTIGSRERQVELLALRDAIFPEARHGSKSQALLRGNSPQRFFLRGLRMRDLGIAA